MKKIHSEKGKLTGPPQSDRLLHPRLSAISCGPKALLRAARNTAKRPVTRGDCVPCYSVQPRNYSRFGRLAGSAAGIIGASIIPFAV